MLFFLMDCGMRRKLIHHIVTEFTCNVLKIYCSFVFPLNYWVILARSWLVVEVTGTGKGIEKLTKVVEKSTSKKSNST